MGIGVAVTVAAPILREHGVDQDACLLTWFGAGVGGLLTGMVGLWVSARRRHPEAVAQPERQLPAQGCPVDPDGTARAARRSAQAAAVRELTSRT